MKPSQLVEEGQENDWSKKIVDIEIEGFVNPHLCSDDRQKVKIVCLKAEEDEIIVRIGDEVLSTNDDGYVNYGSDEIANALNQILGEILIVSEDETNEWSGYLHNYTFANGRVYGEESKIKGKHMTG